MYFNIFEILYSNLAKAVGKKFNVYRQNFHQQRKFYEKAININKPCTLQENKVGAM